MHVHGYGCSVKYEFLLEGQKGEAKMGTCYEIGDSVQAPIMYFLSWYLSVYLTLSLILSALTLVIYILVM